MNITIKNVGHYLPEQIISNQDMIDRFSLRMKAGWVEKIVGIKERRWANEDQATSDLAVAACKDFDLKNFKGLAMKNIPAGPEERKETKTGL